MRRLHGERTTTNTQAPIRGGDFAERKRPIAKRETRKGSPTRSPDTRSHHSTRAQRSVRFFVLLSSNERSIQYESARRDTRKRETNTKEDSTNGDQKPYSNKPTNAGRPNLTTCHTTNTSYPMHRLHSDRTATHTQPPVRGGHLTISQSENVRSRSEGKGWEECAGHYIP